MSTTVSANESTANGHAAAPAPGKARPAIDAALSSLTREFHSLVADVEELVQATGALSGEELARAKLKLQARVSAACSRPIRTCGHSPGVRLESPLLRAC